MVQFNRKVTCLTSMEFSLFGMPILVLDTLSIKIHEKNTFSEIPSVFCRISESAKMVYCASFLFQFFPLKSPCVHDSCLIRQEVWS